MGLRNEFCLLFVTITVTGVLGGEYCYNLDSGYTRWCAYGCCGSLDRNCCDANIALIVGLTVLSVLVISTIIAVVCCCMRRRATRGTVIQTNSGSGLVITSAQTTMTAAGQPMTYTTQNYQPGVYGTPQPYAPQPYAPQPYAAPPQPYPTGQQAPPPNQPIGSAMAPPPYSETQDGGQVNPGFDYKQLN